ncbi:hypothetical protein G4X40_10905 [Rhodococcus sp. D2-41]|uniref:Uncharacterized protein n=1 Tax=Speluncibacter jeojiensis TaxID=2710754 RepID=A0A9X4RG00_9ACTN|nr:hypothetical protein [Rhodococcus sp. D2-41]MDG3010657.1 hypothetical protein [Rhodococcus sp. D2-41]MDG3016837.1 hypothetical protein [Corynebacteriales bacterium D3-21]
MFRLLDSVAGLAAIVIAVILFVLYRVIGAFTRYLGNHPDPRVRLRRKRGTAWVLAAGFGLGFLAALSERHGALAAVSIILCSVAAQWLVNDALRRRRVKRAAGTGRAHR